MDTVLTNLQEASPTSVEGVSVNVETVVAGAVAVIKPVSVATIEMDVSMDSKMVDMSKSFGSCLDTGQPVSSLTKPNVSKAVALGECLECKMLSWLMHLRFWASVWIQVDCYLC
jgi:hypothetical protein